MARTELLSDILVPTYPKFYMAITAESVDRERSSEAETEEFARPHLPLFPIIVLRIVIRVLQILGNVENPNSVSDLKIRLKVRRAALASSPTFCLLSQSRHFLSTSTYSASITPSSFFLASLSPPGCGPAALPLGPAPPSGGGVCACADLYICSASLCDACVRVSRARSICAFSFDSSAFFASAIAFSTSPRSEPEILSPCSFNVFSIW